jgi:hypothetical protein
LLHQFSATLASPSASPYYLSRLGDETSASAELKAKPG